MDFLLQKCQPGVQLFMNNILLIIISTAICLFSEGLQWQFVLMLLEPIFNLLISLVYMQTGITKHFFKVFSFMAIVKLICGIYFLISGIQHAEICGDSDSCYIDAGVIALALVFGLLFLNGAINQICLLVKKRDRDDSRGQAEQVETTV